QIKHVERTRLDEGRHQVGERGAKRDARDRVVDGKRDRAADAVEAHVIDLLAAGGGEDARRVTHLPQLPGQVADMICYAAGRGQVVRGDQTDLHEMLRVASRPDSF